MMSMSSRPSAPSSPACGLSPAKTRRGRASPKSRRQDLDDDGRDLDQILGGEKGGNHCQRHVDGRRHDGEFARPQHHHRPAFNAIKVAGQLAEIFGMPGMGKARAIQHGFGDRVGDHGARAPGVNQGDGAGDRFDRRGRVGRVGASRLADDTGVQGNDRQRRREKLRAPVQARFPRFRPRGQALPPGAAAGRDRRGRKTPRPFLEFWL